MCSRDADREVWVQGLWESASWRVTDATQRRALSSCHAPIRTSPLFLQHHHSPQTPAPASNSPKNTIHTCTSISPSTVRPKRAGVAVGYSSSWSPTCVFSTFIFSPVVYRACRRRGYGRGRYITHGNRGVNTTSRVRVVLMRSS